MPRPKPLAGRIALITGGAGGIGAATAERLLAEGACVMLLRSRTPRPSSRHSRSWNARPARISCDLRYAT